MGTILSTCQKGVSAIQDAASFEQKTSQDLARVSISEAVQECWKLDKNRLRPNVDYVLNVQSGKKPWWPEDKASDPLFTKVNASIWKKPTFSAFRDLLDNYEAVVGQEENLNSQELAEIDRFLDSVMSTAPMKFCHAYCHSKDPENVSSDATAFRKKLFEIWFKLYRRTRGGRNDSSGFDHVFVGEIRDGAISGFHNWIRFYMEEKKGTIDYRGYIKPKSKDESQADSNDHVLTLQFKWNLVSKDIGTMFIGVSPEFEFAVYTMCFLVGTGKNRVTLRTGTDVFEMDIVCHKVRTLRGAALCQNNTSLRADAWKQDRFRVPLCALPLRLVQP